MAAASAYTLEFEKPLLELERQIDDLERLGDERKIDVSGELAGLQQKLESLRGEIYRNLMTIQTALEIVVVCGKNDKCKQSLSRMKVPPQHRARVIITNHRPRIR